MYRTEYAVANASVADDFLDLRHGHGDLFGFGPFRHGLGYVRTCLTIVFRNLS